MRKSKLLYLLFLAIPSMSFTSKNESFFTLTGLEAIKNEEDNTIKVAVRYSSNSSASTCRCYLTWCVEVDGVETPMHSMRMSNFTEVTDRLLTVQPSIDIASLGNENRFIVYYEPSDTGIKQSKAISYNLKGNSQVSFKEKDNDVGVSSGYKVESFSLYDESKNFVNEDRVTFTNYEDIVVEDYYLNFDIKRFNYHYTGNKNKDILDGDFYLCIYDKYNLFNELPLYKDSQYRYIELKPVISNLGSSFMFKNTVYYDPLTHNPSITYKEGYKETDKLYFPIGKLDTLKSIHCLLSFDIKGFTNFNMSSEFNIYFLKNYFGDCSNSEYCVDINSDDGTNIREKVVDINL